VKVEVSRHAVTTYKPLNLCIMFRVMFVPYRHCVTHAQVSDGRYMSYVEQAVEDSRKGLILQVGYQS
jgi:hypothetical protein